MRTIALLLPLFFAPLHAAIITFTGTSDGGSTFNYTASVQNNQQIQSGDYLVIFDFAGLVFGAGPNANWTFSTVSDVAAEPDNPSIADAIFTYTGSSPILGVPSTTPLGTFSLTSSFTGQTPGTYFAKTTRSTGGDAGEPVTEYGNLLAVASGPSAENAVPEPSAMVLAAGGLLALSLARRSRLCRQ